MIGWLDTSSGASGDMLLAALVGVGVEPEVLRNAMTAAAPERVDFQVAETRRGGMRATRAVVDVADSSTHRGLGAVLDLLDDATLDEGVQHHAAAVFTLLGEAEAAVHGVAVDDVHFHEVGALDAVADIVGVCAGFNALGLTELQAAPVAVGAGSVHTSHGVLPVPPPAVVELLRGIPSYAGPPGVTTELCTPTGAALLRHWVTTWGPQPAMTVTAVGVGAGGRDLETHPNMLRLLVGEPTRPSELESRSGEGEPATLVIESNVDDLDPRLWPRVLSRLLAVGASDAWLTPILMKKGRPAHTLSVLVREEHREQVRATLYAETSAIGSRSYTVAKNELERETVTVDVDGCAVRVKVARLGGEVVNTQPEYDDLIAAAETLGRPAKHILAAALAAIASR